MIVNIIHKYVHTKWMSHYVIQYSFGVNFSHSGNSTKLLTNFGHCLCAMQH